MENYTNSPLPKMKMKKTWKSAKIKNNKKKSKKLTKLREVRNECATLLKQQITENMSQKLKIADIEKQIDQMNSLVGNQLKSISNHKDFNWRMLEDIAKLNEIANQIN
jgi:predicted component of type VI protein secretion system